MSNDLRSFLTLPYEALEELNLKAKEQRKSRMPVDKIREDTAQVPDRRERHQGRDRSFQRP